MPKCRSQHTVTRIRHILITDCRELDVRRWRTLQQNFVEIYHVIQMLKWTHIQGQDNCIKNLVLFLLREESWIDREVLMWLPVA